MTSAAEEQAAAEATARIVAWLREEAVAERALADRRPLPARFKRQTKISGRIRMKALAYEEAADAIEAGAHLAAPKERK